MDKIIDQEDKLDWQAALEVLVQEKGQLYANDLVKMLGLSIDPSMIAWNTPSIVNKPINVSLVNQTSDLVLWNAAIMVNEASQYGSEVGGHIASFASSAVLYEVGFNYFFRGNTAHEGDLVLFQGHCAPGVYARSYLLDVLSDEQVKYFRREAQGRGISSYPHPWLMPKYWQFPTVSMGLGPLQGIYHARMMKYMYARDLLSDTDRKVWVFCGDGEMDEVESLGALGVASREQLNNLIFVVNCNLVRLDGPCRGNGSIIDELSGYFSGFGWQVIKLIWSQAWLDLVEKDHTGLLKKALSSLLDGEIQGIFAVEDGLKNWFAQQPFSGLVAQWSNDDFKRLVPGGHDAQLVANAYEMAVQASKPCVILVMTEKGYRIPGVASSNRSHNQKSLSDEQLSEYQKALSGLGSVTSLHDFYKPNHDDLRLKFMSENRQALGGNLPCRVEKGPTLEIPSLGAYNDLLSGDATRSFSTTMVFVRFLTLTLRQESIRDFIVPIIADEGRTLGMEGLFKQLGIYAPGGQKYTPYDHKQISSYKERSNGQLLQEGINEAGAMSSWIAAATAYSVHGVSLIPFYAFYSMFGFQRVGDLIWAAADSRARGFLIGATAGRTTLGGEGLQHNDGTSHLVASTIPNCCSYDPCYGYELTVILQHGMQQMYQKQLDVFYYVTVMNESYHHPDMPSGVEQGIIDGLYIIDEQPQPQVELMASGTILREAQKAAKMLNEDDVSVRVWSVTSWSEAERKCLEDDQWLSGQLDSHAKLVVGVSDYVRALPGLLNQYIDQPYLTLGTDGFGMSDTRSALREHYGISAQAIVQRVRAKLKG